MLLGSRNDGNTFTLLRAKVKIIKLTETRNREASRLRKCQWSCVHQKAAHHPRCLGQTWRDRHHWGKSRPPSHPRQDDFHWDGQRSLLYNITPSWSSSRSTFISSALLCNWEVRDELIQGLKDRGKWRPSQALSAHSPKPQKSLSWLWWLWISLKCGKSLILFPNV